MAETTGFTIWLTGMSGAGKSTLAQYLGARLEAAGRRVEILDAEEVREDLMGVLEPTREARDLYIRRLGFVAEMLTRNGVVAIVAATSPYRETRDEVRRTVGEFVEVFCDCPVETLIERDVKGLYKKALAGDIPNFTGITEPYEPPATPEVTVDSAEETVEDSGSKVVEALRHHGYLASDETRIALFGKGRGRGRRVPSRRAKAARKPAAKAPARGARKPARATGKTAGKPAAKATRKPARATPKAAKAARKPARATRKAAKATRKPSRKAKSPARKPKAAKARKVTKRATGARSPKKPAKRAAGRTRTVSRPSRRAAKVASRRTPKKRR